MANIHTFEDHKYRHYNKALGCMIYSREHYAHEMKRQGMVPFEEAERLAEEYDKSQVKDDYRPSVKALNIIKSIKLSGNDKGNIKIERGSRLYNVLQEMGVSFEGVNYNMGYEGGFTQE